jgi:hypothetical protein
MFPCERVDVGFIDADSTEGVHGRFLLRDSVDLALAPEQPFEMLSDAASWPRWAEFIARRAPR